MKYTNNTNRPITGTSGSFVPEDYCDCEDRCPKCGKKHKPTHGPYTPWEPLRYRPLHYGDPCEPYKPKPIRFTCNRDTSLYPRTEVTWIHVPGMRWQ